MHAREKVVFVKSLIIKPLLSKHTDRKRIHSADYQSFTPNSHSIGLFLEAVVRKSSSMRRAAKPSKRLKLPPNTEIEILIGRGGFFNEKIAKFVIENCENHQTN